MINRIQNNHNNYKPPTFTSRIYVVPFAQFKALESATKPRQANIMLSRRDIATNFLAASAVEIFDCIAGIFKHASGKEDKAFHFKPALMYLNDGYPLNFTEQVGDELTKIPEGTNLKGLVIGGKSRHSDKVNNFYGRKLLKYFIERIKGKNLDFTVLFGQKEYSNAASHANFIYDARNDSYGVSCCGFSSQGDFKEILDPQSFRNHFDIIRISPNDQVFIGGKPIPNSELNKGIS